MEWKHVAWVLGVAVAASLLLMVPLSCAAETPNPPDATTPPGPGDAEKKAPPEPPPVELDKYSRGTVPLQLGRSAVIRLEGNPTTGYQWLVTAVRGDSVTQVGQVGYVQDKRFEGKNMVGAGGMFSAKFKAVKPGVTTVTMEYKRSWETEKKPLQVFTIALDVAPSDK
jgi:predicted secreted protein